MQTKRFEDFFQQLSETNATLNYFTDFSKIDANVSKISLKLNQLNHLLGKDDLRQAINEIYQENEKAFQVLDILIAVRKKDKKKVLNSKGQIVLLESFFQSSDHIWEYIQGTGLAEVFSSKKITNLVDYVFGIEVGLDTNARKNRGGSHMEKTISNLFDKAGVLYKSQVYITDFPEIVSLGEDIKKFDFAIKTEKRTYLIETNFYNSGGSKLNETARAYSDVAPKINRYSQFAFVWITDGHGWHSAKNKLHEAFNIIPCMYNLATTRLLIEQLQNEGIVTL